MFLVFFLAKLLMVLFFEICLSSLQGINKPFCFLLALGPTKRQQNMIMSLNLVLVNFW